MLASCRTGTQCALIPGHGNTRMKRWKILGYCGLAAIAVVLLACLCTILRENVTRHGVHGQVVRGDD